jgi:ATP-dependent Clp endopeptidase proteolytic subunit ClpP
MPQANTPTAPAPWYSIRPLSAVSAAARGVQSAAEVFIYGDIGESWYGDSISASNFVRDINALQVEQMTIRINSYGGSVVDGIAIHNAIKRHKASVTVAIDGLAASIASLIAMAGDQVEMAENAMLMVHAPWGGVSGNAAEMRAYADMLDAWSQSMSTSYASKTGKTAEEMLALLTDGADHWYTAADALAEGFVDAVISASPESASAMASFDLTRFPGVPAAVQARRIHAAAAAIPVAQSTFAQELSMPQGNATTAANPTPAVITTTQAASPDASEVRAAALREDAARRSAIAAAAQPFMAHAGMAEFVAAMQNDHSVTELVANQRILAKLGAGAEPVAGGRVVTVADETDKRRDGMVAALLIRANVADKAAQAAASANPYRGRTLLAIAEASLNAAGIRTEGMNSREIVAASFTQSSSDFPVLLESVMHKTLLGAYATQAMTWNRFCKIGTVSDFRAHNRYRVGSLGNLQPKNELGEYKNVAIPDGEKSSISAATKGFILNISREAIINDDLGAITDQASAAGRAAARTVEVDVYALLASNSGLGPVLSDGKTLFHADHGNIAPGAAMAVDVLDAMRVLMAQQKDVTGNDFLDLRPEILMVPVGLGGSARVIIGAEYDTSVSNKFQVPNKVRGLVRDIVDTPRMAGTRFHLLASPAEAAAIEVAFLDGQSEPYLETAQAFDTDGGRLKVRMDYGVAGHDFRGAVTNAGTA